MASAPRGPLILISSFFFSPSFRIADFHARETRGGEAARNKEGYISVASRTQRRAQPITRLAAASRNAKRYSSEY
jgi:hypothetical protein